MENSFKLILSPALIEPLRVKTGSPHLFLILIPLFFIVFAVAGCATLPDRIDVSDERALAPAATGPLADLAKQFQPEFEGDKSGFSLLTDSEEALEARLALTDLATGSIDLQYYIWKSDAVGTLFFDRLLKAADRGVRVRIIVDDFALASSIRNLSALNSHPNLEIRIFNPNPSRDYPVVGIFHFLASFKELNRRMHNKLMIVDNHMMIAGGRNIGNEYFGLGDSFNFLDIDILAMGSVVEESSHAFDEYWNHDSVYPVYTWNIRLPANTLTTMRETIKNELTGEKARLASYPLQRQKWHAWLQNLESELDFGIAHFIQDDPVEVDGRPYRLIDMLAYLTDPTEHEFLLSTPYLLPVGDFLKEMKEEVEEGVRVRILTNSLSSTNHTIVHSHYRKYRLPILDTGTALYEFRPDPSPALREKADVEPVAAPFISLHAKVVVADERKCFIGSLNFDPRALVINTENGLLLESSGLGLKLTAYLKEMMEQSNAYHLVRNNNGLEWHTEDKVLVNQPSRGFFQSLGDLMGGLLPIESQL